MSVTLGFIFQTKNEPDGAFEVYFDGASIVVPEPGALPLHVAALGTVALLRRGRREPMSGSQA